tara:strand:+ start:2211 stop:2483 length:273 start_codon:yes stop_codon:yes gene_type:complete
MTIASNKRKHSRFASQAQLVVSHPALGVIHLKAKDSSQGGFFALRGSHILPPINTEVDVIIKRHTGQLNNTPVRMRVAHISDQGMGLEFI